MRQGLICHQPLEPGVLLLELLESAELVDLHVPVLPLPAVVGPLRDAVLAADLGLGRRELPFPQDA